jgi:hypothetical protein
MPNPLPMPAKASAPEPVLIPDWHVIEDVDTAGDVGLIKNVHNCP